MRKLLLIGLVFMSSMLMADEPVVSVTMITDSSFGNKAIVETMQRNLSAVLTEINKANYEDRDLQIVGLRLTDKGKQALLMAWSIFHFFIDEEEVVVDHLWNFNDGYMARRIPCEVNLGDKEFGSGDYQEAVVEFDLSGNIKDFRFGMDAQLSESMENCGRVASETHKNILTKFLDDFRNAYNTKDIGYLRTVFSDDALIITGSVVQTRPNDMNMSSSKVVYKKQTKQEYLTNLQRAFQRNNYIQVTFHEIGKNGEQGGCSSFTQSAKNKNYYGIRVKQEWKSTHYSDEGYLFLLVDLSDLDKITIHVRTWQPEYVGGQPLPEDDIFSLKDFDL